MLQGPPLEIQIGDAASSVADRGGCRWPRETRATRSSAKKKNTMICESAKQFSSDGTEIFGIPWFAQTFYHSGFFRSKTNASACTQRGSTSEWSFGSDNRLPYVFRNRLLDAFYRPVGWAGGRFSGILEVISRCWGIKHWNVRKSLLPLNSNTDKILWRELRIFALDFEILCRWQGTHTSSGAPLLCMSPKCPTKLFLCSHPSLFCFATDHQTWFSEMRWTPNKHRFSNRRSDLSFVVSSRWRSVVQPANSHTFHVSWGSPVMLSSGLSLMNEIELL